MKYLENPDMNMKQSDDEFKYSSKTAILNFIPPTSTLVIRPKSMGMADKYPQDLPRKVNPDFAGAYSLRILNI
jgi:hypothetical protein